MKSESWHYPVGLFVVGLFIVATMVFATSGKTSSPAPVSTYSDTSSANTFYYQPGYVVMV